MKKMVLGVVLSSVLFAGESEFNEGTFPKIYKGDWAATGALNVGYATGGIGFNFFSEMTGLHYFIDHLAFGMSAVLGTTTGENKFYSLAGPVIQYHFWTDKLLTTYVKGSILTDLANPLSQYRFMTTLGLDYYASPSLSIGPNISLLHYSDSGQNHNVGSIGGQLGLHF